MGLRQFLVFVIRFADVVVWPIVGLATILLKGVRRVGVSRMPICRSVMLRIGAFPIRAHYYEPLFQTDHLKGTLSKERNLPGIRINEKEQLQLLAQFSYCEELRSIPRNPGTTKSDPHYYYNNDSFRAGDSEIYYSMIRHFKPKKIVEMAPDFRR